MAYNQKEWVSHDGKVIIRDKYHSQKSMPSSGRIREKRKVKVGKSTEKQAAINVKHSTQRLFKKILDNYQLGDWYLTFTLKEQMSAERFKKEYEKALRTLRDYFKKKGQECRYVGVQENLTGRGRPHFHLLIHGKIPMEELNPLLDKAWPLGHVRAEPYRGRAMDARRLAGYFTKEDLVVKTAREGGDVEELGRRSRICSSQNHIQSRETKTRITKAESFSTHIVVPKGYTLVEEISIVEYHTEDGYLTQHLVFERLTS